MQLRLAPAPSKPCWNQARKSTKLPRGSFGAVEGALVVVGTAKTRTAFSFSGDLGDDC